MKEQLDYQPTSEIKWPHAGKIEVGSSVDFVYIMRKDGNFIMSSVAHRMASEYFIDEEQTKQILLEEYDTYFDKLASILQWGYASRGNFELHLYDPNELDKGIRIKAGGLPIVSLDPLMYEGVLEHKVSRGYYLSGKKDFGQVARPGTLSLSQQAQEIAASLNGSPASVAEDDIFSGGSVIASLNVLKEQGVIVQKLIPGIQVGKPSKLSEMGMQVDPVVMYETTDGADVFDKVDLGDPRDYLLGASGLVVKLPNGHFGRTPYVLPFVSTNARAGIPQEIEKEFSIKVLQTNLEFFKSVEDSIGKPILLKNMDSNFVVLMNEMFGFDSNTPMNQVVTWSMDNIDNLWEVTKALGEFQEKLAVLELPENIVFVDVNGTLIPDESADGFISNEHMLLLQQTLEQAKKKGLSIGLCSDSPLQQLQEFAAKLGIDGPIIAENGNLVFHSGKTLVINSLASIEAIKAQIYSQASELNYQQGDDCVAPEFGGSKVNFESNSWSFGANRQTSITVFGPSTLIESLGVTFNTDYSVDASPKYNYFAIHPGSNYKVNKGQTLNVLSLYGHNVIMVGNSTSDWVEPTLGAQCAFVSNSRITKDVTEKAAYISNKDLVEGVVDTINNIQ